MTDTSTSDKFVFNFNRWLSRELDDGDMVRELPVIVPGKEPLQGKMWCKWLNLKVPAKRCI